MLVSEFINQYIHPVLTQRGLNLVYSPQALLDFINLALNDIYTFEGKVWSFMYSYNVPVTPTGSGTTYTFTTSTPLVRVVNCHDNRTVSWTVPKLVSTTVNMKYGDYFFVPHTKDIVFYDNAETEGMVITYTHTFNRLTDATDTIPLPDIFLSALMLITMGYVYPGYGQFGEGKDAQIDNKGMARLRELAKMDSPQTPLVHSNIK